ncbi:hypothetical protein ACQP1S_21085 [Micromonospora matsumotoense]|uniref:hypothetical protein n=1 Tax=Micromonospora matsumotoense TaxID=121616 RepID=UPI003D8CE85F
MIVTTGATGALSGATTDHLLQRVPASDIVVAVRDEAEARRFADLGVEVGIYQAAQQCLFAGVDPLLSTLLNP